MIREFNLSNHSALRRAMRTLFERTVRTAVAMELVDLAVQAVDGTKIGASASLYRSHNASELRALLARLERAIVDLEAQNETGTEPTPTALPEEFSTKEAPRGRQLEHGLEPR